MKNLYLIGGTMGVGKTTVCRQLKEDLPRSVFLDGDWCWDASPFQVTEETKTMVIENICFLLNSFLRCTAYENIIFCWVMHQQEIIDAILSKLTLENCSVKCVSLLADEQTVRERLLKDINAGLRKEPVITRSTQRLPLYLSLDTLKVDTRDKSVRQIAKEIAGL